MNTKINKLNVMNYQVNIFDGYYFLTNGVRDIFEFCKLHNLNFKQVCLTLLDVRQFSVKHEKIGMVSITMI